MHNENCKQTGRPVTGESLTESVCHWGDPELHNVNNRNCQLLNGDARPSTIDPDESDTKNIIV